MTDSFTYLEPYAQRPDQRFYMSGVGLREVMSPGIVHRPNGTWDWLFMYFHTPIDIEVDGRVTRYPDKTLMIWDDSQSHYYGHRENGWTHSWIHCQGSVVPEYLDGARLRPGPYPDLDIERVLESYLPRIHEERRRNDLDSLILEGLFQCLLFEFRRVVSPTTTVMPTPIVTAKRYVDAHFADSIRLTDLCRIAAMSKPHFIAEFKKHVGAPPIDYLISVRLDHARSLLLDRNLTITEVAQKVGYADIYHFSKIFKKRLGSNPSAFRG